MWLDPGISALVVERSTAAAKNGHSKEKSSGGGMIFFIPGKTPSIQVETHKRGLEQKILRETPAEIMETTCEEVD